VCNTKYRAEAARPVEGHLALFCVCAKENLALSVSAMLAKFTPRNGNTRGVLRMAHKCRGKNEYAMNPVRSKVAETRGAPTPNAAIST